jgi:alpha-L-fucosidase
MIKEELLKRIDEVIAQGAYKDTWESLCRYAPPKWYTDAKFGIFIHWGVYSVPAFGNEWYPRHMYVKGTREYEHHLKTWGDKFGYKDFIPLFRAEKFDPREWMELFREAGAKYVMPVAEHHDGFSMYRHGFSKWNAAEMGPKRDVLGELKKAADELGIVFSFSFHRAEHIWFFNGGKAYPCDVMDPAYEDFYGKQQDYAVESSHDIYSLPQPSKEHCEDWLVRICDLVERYQPRIVWFDWWIHNVGWKQYLKKFAAYYYNLAAQWGAEVAINYKYNAYAYGSAVYDVERGQLAGINPRLWQTDTAVAKNSWGYTENNDFKNPVDIAGDLVDIVSKNGVLLLNIGPRPDGTITSEDRRILLDIGGWLRKNGEGIYGTTYWQQYGEGPTQISEGAFKDTDRGSFTPGDFRFTYKNGTLYAFVMKYPKDGKIFIPSLKRHSATGTGDFDIQSVRALGYDAEVSFSRNAEGLNLELKGPVDTEYPVGFAIRLE